MMTIHLNDLRFYAFHGIHPQEKKAGGDFLVNLTVQYPEASKQHTLDSTIDYVVLHDLVKQCMALPTELLENVAEDICEKIKSRFSQLSSIEIKITKIRPPIPGINGSTGITLQRTY